MLEVRRLEMLLEVGRTGSFAAAADALSFTPSAVSQQMCALERATRVLLFDRNARGVELTDAGRALREHAEAVVARLAEAEAELHVIGGINDSRLRFGSFSSATGAFAAEAFKIFGERYPDSELSFSDGEPYESIAALSANELDLAVVFELDEWPAGMDYRGATVCRELQLECVPLFDDPLLLVVPAGHRLADSRPVTIHQLADQTVLASPPWHRDFEKACRGAGVQPHLDFSCRGTGFEALQALVAVGRGITLMPRLALGWLREDLVVLPLEGAPIRHVKAAVFDRPCRSSASQAMLEILTGLTERLGTAAEPSVAAERPLDPVYAA